MEFLKSLGDLSPNQVWFLAVVVSGFVGLVIGWLYGRRGNTTVPLAKINKTLAAMLVVIKKQQDSEG